MDLLLLRSFLAVDETGSFSAAAERLGCVQSNVTARIRRLEAQFGEAAFERGKGGARLTAFGERLRAHAVALLDHAEEAERDLMEHAGARAALRLGSMETTAALRLPPLLKRLRAAAPGAPISLQTGPTATLLREVWDRKLDAAFVAGPADPDRFHWVRAFEEQLVLAQAAENTGPDSGSGAEGPLIAFRQGCSYRASAEAWLKSAGRMDVETIEMGAFDGILGCVAAGLGFAIMPEAAIRANHAAAELSLTPLPEPFGATETLLVLRIDRKPTAALEALIGLLDPGARATS